MSGLAAFDSVVGPQEVSDMWTVTRDGLLLRCVLWSHSLGWELQVVSDDELVRSQLCQTEKEVFNTSQTWKARAVADGWQ